MPIGYLDSTHLTELGDALREWNGLSASDKFSFEGSNMLSYKYHTQCFPLSYHIPSTGHEYDNYINAVSCTIGLAMRSGQSNVKITYIGTDQEGRWGKCQVYQDNITLNSSGYTYLSHQPLLGTLVVIEKTAGYFSSSTNPQSNSEGVSPIYSSSTKVVLAVTSTSGHAFFY